jgi:cytochrome c oxidase subunit II
MPAPVRRTTLPLIAALTGVLVFAAAAAASNGGISPVTPVSPNAHRITDAFWLILAITGAIFVLVEALLIVFVVRYRRGGRRRTEAAPGQTTGNTRLETIWTLAPVVLLAVIVAFVFYKLPGIKNAPAATNSATIDVEGHQFYWLFKYPDGRQSINTLTVPVDQVVSLDVTSPDVIHSWWVPAFGGKIDAIPGTVNHTWFRAEKTGTYPIRCAEFCGVLHAGMKGTVDVVNGTATPATGAALGKEAFTGVCASCHGPKGEGDIGPAIATSPTLSDAKSLREIIRNGTGNMPPVGKTWNDALMNATVAYLMKNVAGGAESGG